MRVLVTGAGGLLGGELAGALAERGHGVVGLIHQTPTVRRNDGGTVGTRNWAGSLPDSGVITLTGDVREPGFGLDGTTQAALRGIDVVVHCAAVTGFDCDREVYRTVNEAGAAHAIGIAEAAGARLVHVSTAYVCGERSGAVLESELDCRQSFANGYEASKAAAERLVQAAMARGLPAAIARPSIVVGRSSDGVVGAFDNMYAFIRLVTGGLIRVLPVDAGASLDLVPIDHVIAGLVAMVERNVAGRTLHLASGRPVLLGTLIDAGRHYPQFRLPEIVDADSFRAESLSATEQRLFRAVTTLYANYLRRDPRFDTSEAEAVLGVRCPMTDDSFLRRLIDFGVQAGSFRGARRAAKG